MSAGVEAQEYLYIPAVYTGPPLRRTVNALELLRGLILRRNLTISEHECNYIKYIFHLFVTALIDVLISQCTIRTCVA